MQQYLAKIETTKKTNKSPDLIVKRLVQKSIVSFGIVVTTNTGEDITDQYGDVRKKGKYSAREVVPLIHRRAFCNDLFANNKVSDEYYTEKISYERFIHTYNLEGQTVFEPFYGDGTSIREMGSLVNMVGEEGADFWDIYKDPRFNGMLILSNPPFSFKWQVIITLLEQRRNFALILPWETFYDKRDKDGTVLEECPLKKYQRKFGGEFVWFKCRPHEQIFFHPTEKGGEYKQIGTHILYWRFDGDFTTNQEYIVKTQRRTAGRKLMRKVFDEWKTYKTNKTPDFIIHGNWGGDTPICSQKMCKIFNLCSCSKIEGNWNININTNKCSCSFGICLCT